MRLSDTITDFIKEMLENEQDREIELKRNEMAEYFHCAPSQINYVLATRFSPDRGYLVTSQRGGGGCIRIVRVTEQKEDYLSYLLSERIGDRLTQAQANALCIALAENGAVTKEQALLLSAAVSPQALSVPVPETVKETLRARILKTMLYTIADARRR